MNNSCKYCTNAFTCSELNSTNDLSYFSVGETLKHYSAFIRTGAGLPTAIIFSHYDDKIMQNVDIGIYIPKYCPECGRNLFENE